MPLDRTWCAIDLPALAHNYRVLNQLRGGTMGVVKADAYGHGAVEAATVLEREGCPFLCVACLGEAMGLREAGIRSPVLILGHTPPEETGILLRLGLSQTVYDAEQAAALSAAAIASGGTLPVHIKVDTGMARLGFWDDDAEIIAKAAKLPGLQAEALCTHFSSADTEDAEDAAYTKHQTQRFLQVQEALSALGITFSMTHCANSGAILHHPRAGGTHSRPGLALYGISSRDIGLVPCLSWFASVIACKTLPQGQAVGYGRTFITSRETRMAVLSVGYADGYFRSFSNKAEVMVRGARAKIIGNVCMDLCMVDVTDIPGVHPGDTATLMGSGQNREPTAAELAAWANTIPYEILTSIGKRVERRYMR
jgi:alanine racemase